VSDKQVRVTFQPSGRAVFVLPGTKMLEAAGRAGLAIQTPCGGKGTCGKCRVQVNSGPCAASAAEKEILGDSEVADGWRLACQTEICAETVVTVPASSLFASRQQILTEAASGAGADILPGVRKIYVELDAATLADSDSDLMRLERSIGAFKIDLSLLRRLPKLLRRHDLKGTAVLADHRLIDFEPGDTTESCYGAAFDIGTTTLVGSLLDLRTGEERGLCSRMNPQVSFGDDVLSRIRHASAARENLAELRRSIITAVGEMVEDLCRQASISPGQIYEAALAGNTTMEHLLCGLDVEQLGHVPFAPVHGRGLLLAAGELGLPIHHSGSGYVFPVISGFVGGDAVAGILATRLTEADGPTLMVDIGTNGEIVLAHDGRIWAASTAAGPAFEGARISCGMRATTGAIEKIVFADDLNISVIGNVAPVGLCGSALVDLAAGLLATGIVSPQGRLLPPNELPAGLPEGRRCARDDHAARRSRASTGHRRDPRGREHPAAPGPPGRRGPSPRPDSGRVRQLHQAKQRPAHRAAARADRSQPHSLRRQHLAERRQVGAAEHPRQKTGRATRQRRPARAIVRGCELPDGVRRGDDLPGHVSGPGRQSSSRARRRAATVKMTG